MLLWEVKTLLFSSCSVRISKMFFWIWPHLCQVNSSTLCYCYLLCAVISEAIQPSIKQLLFAAKQKILLFIIGTLSISRKSRKYEPSVSRQRVYVFILMWFRIIMVDIVTFFLVMRLEKYSVFLYSFSLLTSKLMLCIVLPNYVNFSTLNKCMCFFLRVSQSLSLGNLSYLVGLLS